MIVTSCKTKVTSVVHVPVVMAVKTMRCKDNGNEDVDGTE